MSRSDYFKTRRQLLAGLSIISLVTPLWAESVRPSNKWRIEFSEGANSDGVITFLLAPEVGQGQIVKASIPDGTSENHVARITRDAFRQQLPEDQYHIETDDGEDLLVKRKHGAPDFAIELLSNSAKSVRIHLQRE